MGQVSDCGLAFTGSLGRVTFILKSPGLPAALWKGALAFGGTLGSTGELAVRSVVAGCQVPGGGTVTLHSDPAPAKVCGVQYSLYKNF